MRRAALAVKWSSPARFAHNRWTDAGLVYASGGGREPAMDVYRPAGQAPGTRLPAVLLVHGEASSEMLRGLRGWGQYSGWGRLLAGEGLAGVVFEHHAFDLVDDTDASRDAIGRVLAFLRGHLAA